jgi:hypothetical protein
MAELCYAQPQVSRVSQKAIYFRCCYTECHCAECRGTPGSNALAYMALVFNSVTKKLNIKFRPILEKLATKY